MIRPETEVGQDFLETRRPSPTLAPYSHWKLVPRLKNAQGRQGAADDADTDD